MGLKVLYLIHHAGKGGTERYVQSLAVKLGGDGRVEPFFAYTEKGLLTERMEELGVPTFYIPMPGRYDLKAAKNIAALCREHNIDVIHTQFLRENYIAMLSRLFYSKPSVVYTNHLILPNNTVTRLSNRMLSPTQGAVIAVCNPGREQMILNGIPAAKITVIHNGVDPQEWSDTGDRSVRARVGVPDDVPVLVYAARFVEGKGHAGLMEALAVLKKEHMFHMLLTGDGPLLDDTRALAERLGISDRVTFLGFTSDMRSVLNSCDICVNAAGTEACSFNILEAMAAGLPVAAADAGGNPDLVDGTNGLLFTCDDPKAMAASLGRLISDAKLRGGCAEKALESARGRFNISVMLDKTYDIYQSVCK